MRDVMPSSVMVAVGSVLVIQAAAASVAGASTSKWFADGIEMA